MKDVVFYWTRGNLSVSGLDTLQLAQYTLEDYYTSESEAVYETGMCLLSHSVPTTSLYFCNAHCIDLSHHFRQVPKADLPLPAEAKHPLLYSGDICAI